MRRASQNVATLREGDNLLLSFGYDFCAEHEFGIGKLRSAFGVSNDETDLTVQRYAVTTGSPEKAQLIETPVKTTDYSSGRGKSASHKRLFLLGGDEGPYGAQTVEEFVAGYRESYPSKDKPQAHWDEGAFLFSAPKGGPDDFIIRSIHTALIENDALIYLAGSSNPFGGSGLVIVRRSTIPRKLIDQMESGFRDRKAIKDAAEATGIRERIERWARSKGGYGRGFYALSPDTISANRRDDSKHPVMFWLNPQDQQNNNHGWFTVEELELWMEGKGPVPKRAAA